MKNLKKLSRNELKKLNGGKMIPDFASDGCYVNWVACPGNGPARVVGASQGMQCC